MRHQQLLIDAVKLMGSERVAQVLKVSEGTLKGWVNGIEPMPASKLGALAKAAVDLAKRLQS